MPVINFRNKLHLYRCKVVATLLLVSFAFVAEAQRTRWVRKNNPNYDDKKLTYGFLIGLHTNEYRVKYSDQFVTQDFDTVHSVTSDWKKGFALGFIVNYKIADFFDIRLTPTVAFLEYELRYMYTVNSLPTDVQPVETTMVEFPVLLKYKSERRDNIRMYMIGGIKPSIEASGKKSVENSSSGIKVKGGNISLEAGFGFDLYYPLFKFSPEIRFSRGLVNMLENTTNKYGQPLQSLTTNTITIYLLFQ